MCVNVARSPDNYDMSNSSTASPPCNPSHTIKNPALTPSHGRWMSASENAALVEEGKRTLLAVKKKSTSERERLNSFAAITPTASAKRAIEAVGHKEKAAIQLPSSPMATIKNAPGRSPPRSRQAARLLRRESLHGRLLV